MGEKEVKSAELTIGRIVSVQNGCGGEATAGAGHLHSLTGGLVAAWEEKAQVTCMAV